eukprot:TRINITY_DN27217_c0_g1_i1.p1 TRINITY_DN27217_c0_g1~~TRINITY_DN27217_c0_g1_i1.p1  ORF type:complete len:311 (+),score=44.14 TRINITY_DN27217_c0_g1_i1:129-1061(+)
MRRATEGCRHGGTGPDGNLCERLAARYDRYRHATHFGPLLMPYDEDSELEEDERSRKPPLLALLVGTLGGAGLILVPVAALMASGRLQWVSTEAAAAPPPPVQYGAAAAAPGMFAASEDVVIAPDDGKSACQSWCAESNRSASEKCSWRSGVCSACSECKDVVEPLIGTCHDWCSVNNNPWSKKCEWAGCRMCLECSRSESAEGQDVADEVTRGAPVFGGSSTPPGYQKHAKGVCWVDRMIDSDASAPENMNLKTCASRCNSNPYCGCFMYQQRDPYNGYFKGKCWMESRCNFYQCRYADGSVDSYARTR